MEKKEIQYATPVIDGHLDDVYKTSFCFTEAPLEHLFYYPAGREAAEKAMAHTEGKAWYLYDDRYLYVCAVVHDETICSRGEAWRMSTIWPWDDDGAEIYLWFSDADCMAIHSDAHGYRSVVDEHIRDNHVSNLTYHDLGRDDWAASIDAEAQNYTIEFRVPLPDYVHEGSEIGTLLEIDDRWAVGDGTENMVGALYSEPRVVNLPMYRVRLGAKHE